MMRASGEDGAMSFAAFRKTVRHLYEGATPEGVRFRYALLAFDIVTVLFIIATSFLSHRTTSLKRSMCCSVS